MMESTANITVELTSEGSNAPKTKLDSVTLFQDPPEVVTPTDDVEELAALDGLIIDDKEPEKVVGPEKQEKEEVAERKMLTSISARTQAGAVYTLKDEEVSTTIFQLKELIAKQEGSLKPAGMKLILKGKPLTVSYENEMIKLLSFYDVLNRMRKLQ